MPLEFVKSNINDKKHWKCTEYAKFKCRARCHTENEDFMEVSSHNYVQDAAKVEARKTIEKIKIRGISTQEATHQIVAAALQDVSVSVCGQLPPVRDIKQLSEELVVRLGSR